MGRNLSVGGHALIMTVGEDTDSNRDLASDTRKATWKGCNSSSRLLYFHYSEVS